MGWKQQVGSGKNPVVRRGKSVGIHKLNVRSKNGFFGDPVLFQIASAFHASLVPELAELGAYTVSDEEHEKARLVNSYLPQFRFCDEWGTLSESIDVHPAYHSLLTRSRHAGIGCSLFEDAGEESHVRYQARAVRLFLLAGLESGHLEELCQSSAGFHVLAEDAELFTQWKPLLTSPVHDPSSKPFPQKHGGSLTLAIGEEHAAAASPSSASMAEVIYADLQTRREFYGIAGCKTAVVNPVVDGFIVSAAFEGKQSLFLVPRLLATGKVNSIFLEPVKGAGTGFSAPCCNVRFQQSAGWMIGIPGTGHGLLARVEQDLAFDHAVMIAGMIRSVLHHAVTYTRQNHDKQPGIALAERALADAALDGAAASVLVLRLARALDLAEKNPQEAAFAAIMRPAIRYWLLHVLGQVIDCAVAVTDSRSPLPGSLFSRAIGLRMHNFYFDGHANLLVLEVVKVIRQAPDMFRSVVTALGNEIGTAGTRTTEVLRVAADMALSDEGAAFLLVEQLVYAFASANLHALDCDAVATAYIESRLGGQWRSTYGMLSPRYNAGFILEALYPSH